MDKTSTKCPIWGTSATYLKTEPAIDGVGGGIEHFNSADAGGQYSIDKRGRDLLRDRQKAGFWTDEDKAYLTAWLRAQRATGNECPRVRGRDLDLHAIDPRTEPLQKEVSTVAGWHDKNFRHASDSKEEFMATQASIDRIVWMAMTLISVPPVVLARYLGHTEAGVCKQFFEKWQRKLEEISKYSEEEGKDNRAGAYQQFGIELNNDLSRSPVGFYVLQVALQYAHSFEKIKELELRSSATMALVESRARSIGRIEAAMKEAASAAGASVFAKHFEDRADGLRQQANRWLRTAIGCGFATIAIALWLAADFKETLLTADSVAMPAIIGLALGKTAVLAVLFLSLAWCGKSYRALKHQESVDAHRATGLKTFRTFVEGAEEPTVRDAVLLATTKSIFGNMPTGFVDEQGASGSADVNIVEVIREASKQAKGGPH